MKAMKALLIFLFIALVFGQRIQRGFHVKLENLSGGSILPSSLSPAVWAVHSGASNPFFTPGTTASNGLQTYAEQGNPTFLVSETTRLVPGILSIGTQGSDPTPLAGFVGSSGIEVGATVNFGIRAKPGDHFSLISQFWESNDAFLSTNTSGIPLFDSNGNAMSGTYDLMFWDAGTEQDEPPGAGYNQIPRQASASSGVKTSLPVAQVNLGSLYPAPFTVARLTITAATMFRVRLENIGNYTGLSPPVWAVSLSPNAVFTVGQAASTGVKDVAQGGNPTALLSELSTKKNVLFSGVGATAPITQGRFAEWAVPGVPGSNINIIFMYGASSDRFWATPHIGLPLFTPSGPLSEPLVQEIKLYDAGTAINQRPGAVTSRPAENSVVKDALLGNPDGFTYGSTETSLRLSITPIADAPGYTSPIPNQNVYVSFSFNEMIRA